MNLFLGALAGLLVWMLIEWCRATGDPHGLSQRAMLAWARDRRARGHGPISPISEQAALRILDDLVGDDLETARNVAIHLVRDARTVGVAARRFVADARRLSRLDALGVRVVDDARVTGVEDDEWLRDRRLTREMAWKCMIRVIACADDEPLLEAFMRVARNADGSMRPHVVRLLALSGNVTAARCAAGVAEEWRDDEDGAIRDSWRRRPRHDSNEYLSELANVARRATSLSPTARAWILWQAGQLDREWQGRLGLELPYAGEDVLNHLKQLAWNGATPAFDDISSTWEAIRDSLRGAAEKSPLERFNYKRAMGHVATLAGRSGDERAVDFIRGLIEEVGEEQVEIADGLLCVAGLPRLSLIGSDAGNSRSSPERLAELVLNLDAEVCKGGFVQYFLNSAGDQCEETIRVLEHIGAPQCARLLKSAAMIVGGSRILNDDAMRNRAVGTLSLANAKKLDALSSKYYGRTEPLFVRAADWILEHLGEIPEDRRAALAALPR